METNTKTVPEQRLGGTEPVRAVNTAGSEWNALGLRPVAHWVSMPTADGGRRLAMVWAVPDPVAGV